LRERDHFAAIAATRQMLHHPLAFRFRQRLLGENGEQVGIRMTFCDLRP
jgi:hypothetical protein